MHNSFATQQESSGFWELWVDVFDGVTISDLLVLFLLDEGFKDHLENYSISPSGHFVLQHSVLW